MPSRAPFIKKHAAQTSGKGWSPISLQAASRRTTISHLWGPAGREPQLTSLEILLSNNALGGDLHTNSHDDDSSDDTYAMAPFATPLSCSNSLSTAKLFVQLAPKRGSEPVLEFLLPRGRSVSSRRPFHNSSVHTRGAQTSTGARHGSFTSSVGWGMPRGILSANAAPSTRIPKPFAHMTRRGYTQAVYNPQQDEDGNDMTLEITPRAAKVRGKTSPIVHHASWSTATHLDLY